VCYFFLLVAFRFFSMGIRDPIQAVARWLMVVADALVGNISRCFREGAEVRWRVLPPHRKDQRECDKLFLIGRGWYDDAKLRDIRRANADPVETVCYVHFA
jgi:hypothetical protein